MPQFIAIFKTLFIGSLAGFAAFHLGAPAPFIMGPAIAVSVACLSGLKLVVTPLMRDVCFIFIGLSMGSGATPAVIEAAKKWPLSFVILAICIYIIMVFGTIILKKIYKFNPRSALLAVTPGHLSFVLAMSEDVGADTQKIALIQSLRLLAITLVLPFILMVLDLSLPKIEISPQNMGYGWIIGLTLAAAATGFILKKLSMPAAYLIGGMLVATLTHITGFIAGNVPQTIVTPAFIVMGCLIGTRFDGIKLQVIKDVLMPSLTYFCFALCVAALGAYITYLITGLPFAQILIAFTPGGVEAMIAMALLLNADPTFVAAHHIMRLFILAVMLPWLMMRIKKAE